MENLRGLIKKHHLYLKLISVWGGEAGDLGLMNVLTDGIYCALHMKAMEI